MTTLVTSGCQNLLAHVIAIDMRDDAIAIRVRELDWERLESVPLWHVVFDAVLELHGGEISSTDSLKFVVCKRCRK